MKNLKSNQNEAEGSPKFINPPVVEVFLSVQFKPLVKFRVTDFGKFGIILADSGFTSIQEQAPLPHQIEQKNVASPLFHASIQLTPMLPRVWYLAEQTKDGQQLIQLQNDRLILNWRTGLAKVSYPSYALHRAKFLSVLKSFLTFVAENKLGEVLPDQCEMAYINNIKAVDVGTRENFERCFQLRLPVRALSQIEEEPENLSFAASFWSQKIHGRVAIQAGTMTSLGSDTDGINLQISARGVPLKTSIDGLMDWLDIGHNVLVTTFVDLTTSDMHKNWGIR